MTGMKKEEALRSIGNNSEKVLYTQNGYFSYFTANNSTQLYAKVIQRDAQICEYIFPDRPVPLFFDIDIAATEVSVVNIDAFDFEVISNLQRALTASNILQDYKVLTGVLTCHRQAKFSFHVVFRFFKNNKEFLFKNIQNLLDFIKVNFGSNNFVDMSVYKTKGGLMRCMNQTKYKTPGTSLIKSTNLTDARFKNIQFLISHHESAFEFFPETIHIAHLPKNKGFSEEDNSQLKIFKEALCTKILNEIFEEKMQFKLIGLTNKEDRYFVNFDPEICPLHELKHRSNHCFLKISKNNIEVRCHNQRPYLREIQLDTDVVLNSDLQAILFSSSYNLEEKIIQSINIFDKGVKTLLKNPKGFLTAVTSECDPLLLSEFDPETERDRLEHNITPCEHFISNISQKKIKVENPFTCLFQTSVFIQNNINIHFHKENESNIPASQGSKNLNFLEKYPKRNLPPSKANNMVLPPHVLSYFDDGGENVIGEHLINSGLLEDVILCDETYYMRYNKTFWLKSKNAKDLMSYILHAGIAVKEEVKNILVGEERKRFLRQFNNLLSTKIDSIVRFLRPKLKSLDFLTRLDADYSILPFYNGVYDLVADTFRPYAQRDIVSLTVRYDYDATVSTELAENIISAMFPRKNEFNYLLYLLCSIIYKRESADNLIFFIGNGANGKSILFALLHEAFGDCVFSAPSGMFNVAEIVDNPSPTILSLKGKRLALMSEPPSNKMKASSIKKFCGNEKITARQLFEPTQYSFFLKAQIIIAANSVPEFDAADSALWRRIRFVNFRVVFSDKPKLYQKQKDKTLFDRITTDKRYAVSFINLLLNFEKTHKGEIFEEPKDFAILKDELKEDSIPFSVWLSNRIVFRPGSKLANSEIISVFSRENSGSFELMTPRKMSRAISDYINANLAQEFETVKPAQFSKDGTKRGWANITLKPFED